MLAEKLVMRNECFEVLDSANTAYKLKIKEALHIMWEGPVGKFLKRTMALTVASKNSL